MAGRQPWSYTAIIQWAKARGYKYRFRDGGLDVCTDRTLGEWVYMRGIRTVDPTTNRYPSGGAELRRRWQAGGSLAPPIRY